MKLALIIIRGEKEKTGAGSEKELVQKYPHIIYEFRLTELDALKGTG